MNFTIGKKYMRINFKVLISSLCGLKDSYIHTNGEADMPRWTSFIILIKNIYTLW